METVNNSFESLFQKLEAYGKTTIQLSKLKSLEMSTVLASSLISRLAVILVLSTSTLVLSIGVALWLGELLGRIYYGFFVVAGFYLLAGIIFHLYLHQWIKRPVSNLIIKQALQ
ncbi:hypothetical protein RT717_13990 [Imperialibacter roseus]|uniref:Phage holin family protein n=1 Tax=Imperialibacter roseus TaxID=1324217 RepID=A0ABZ0IHQ5_9BACT|nr:hypothetical protein [Imperialibacter roseus]WOK04186.1 hypothetical protein RT717_13990 [Imperialibacter roseus]